MSRPPRTASIALLALALVPATRAPGDEGPGAGSLPGTRSLELEGDIASQLVSGVDRFLSRKIEEAVARRDRHWDRDLSSVEAYRRSVAPNRKRLARRFGVRGPRPRSPALELMLPLDGASRAGRGRGWEAIAVRWPALEGVHGEGVLLRPLDRDPVADIIVLPDADVAPEALCGLVPGVPPRSRVAQRLVEAGCRVVVPALVSRGEERRGPPGGRPRARLTHREFLHRPAYELGRHIAGYEVEKVLALADALHGKAAQRDTALGLWGHGEGALVGLVATALAPRIEAAVVSGHFGPRRGVWREPVTRSAFGLLDEFGDAEVASLIAPRRLVVEAARGPETEVGGEGGAPGRIRTPTLEAVEGEVERARGLVQGLPESEGWLRLVVAAEAGGVPRAAPGREPPGDPRSLDLLLEALGTGARTGALGPAPEALALPDADARLRRAVAEIERHTQRLLVESPYRRKRFLADLDTSSEEAFRRTQAEYRRLFRERVTGTFDESLLPPAPRSRAFRETERWTAHEVVLDVFPDVIAYGILLLPRGVSPDAPRPVVVCQHGLEGRPASTIAPSGQPGHRFYKAFAARLAERGFITFAPQNLYIFGDRFRRLQRKAKSIGRTIFSVMVPQHRQIVRWLASLPWVDGDRIGFYGLSYGGKSAMRIPPLVEEYALSVCSADFNDWVWKNASTRSPYSYVWTGEYEIFEFDLGSTFSYAEMATLIAPRPFFVERGHHDGVAPDERVALEFAKVRRFYAVRLDRGERCGIEFFDGPHTIHGEGSFAFLHRWLRWPAPGERKREPR